MLNRSLSLADHRPLRYATFFYLYVMQGIPSGFALTVIANYLVAEGVSAKAVGTFAATVGLPWTFQFVWGPLIDRFQQSAMGQRKPWVVFSQFMAFLASLGILFVREPSVQLTMLSVVFFIHSVFASVQDASVDAMAISLMPESERGRVNAFMRAGWLVGIGGGAAGLAYVLQHGGFFYAALTQSLLLLAMTVLTFFIKERSGDALIPLRAATATARIPVGTLDKISLRWLFTELFKGLFSPRSLSLFGAIALVYICQSVFRRVFSVYLIQQLGWSDSDVSVLGSYGAFVSLLVIFVGGLLADRIGVRKLLMVVMLIVGSFLLIFNLLTPLWSDTRVATTGLVLWYTMEPGFSIAAMPLLMALCRKGVEGSQFTTYMALVNLSEVVGAYISGRLMDWLSASVIGIVCGCLVMGALLLIRIVYRRNRQRRKADVTPVAVGSTKAN